MPPAVLIFTAIIKYCEMNSICVNEVIFNRDRAEITGISISIQICKMTSIIYRFSKP
jgi:hypothetical protein